MAEVFSVSQAAKIVGTTSETLRHYDRIGLVKPSQRNGDTGYRYYTRADLVRLSTVLALQQMDLSLGEIGQVLGYGDLEKIVAFLHMAEDKADRKIAELQRGKEKLRLARASYQEKLPGRREERRLFRQEFPQRHILLSQTREAPTLENLWNYLGHFIGQLSPEERDQYAFEDLAGVFTREGVSRLFAVCTRWGSQERVTLLPAGTYLCSDCREEDREAAIEELLAAAKQGYGVTPEFTLQWVVVSGILQWNYQAQVYLGR